MLLCSMHAVCNLQISMIPQLHAQTTSAKTMCVRVAKLIVTMYAGEPAAIYHFDKKPSRQQGSPLKLLKYS